MALTVEIVLLSGRYVATRFNDRSRAEWPPHPARWFSAAVATWADAEPRQAEEEAVLRWLELQGAPFIACSTLDEITTREGATHFVPVNDAAAARAVDEPYAALTAARAAAAQIQSAASGGQVAARDHKRVVRDVKKALKRVATASRTARERRLSQGALAVLPEERGRQARSFPSVRPDSSIVTFRWPDAAPDPEQRAVLDGLLSRIGRLGHSSSLVSCRLTDEDKPAWLEPHDLGDIVLRVPGAGQFDLLEEDYLRHRGMEPRALAAARQHYREAAALEIAAPGSVFSRRFAVLEIDDHTAPSSRGALQLARALRAALVERAGHDAPELLNGRRAADGSPSRSAHLAIAPLPFVGHQHADGLVKGVALVMPGDREDERDVVLSTVFGWLEEHAGRLRVGAREVILQRGEGVDSIDTLRASRWCKAASTWATVTPIALDRWPGEMRARDPARRATAFARAEELVAQSCVHIGLPVPSDIEVRPDAFVSGVPPAHQFPAFRTPNGGPQRALVHALVRFEGPVTGPVLLGAGRYLGQGLCVPLEPLARRASPEDARA